MSLPEDALAVVEYLWIEPSWVADLVRAQVLLWLETWPASSKDSF